MAISTSGVSVPQLGQNIDPSIYGSQNAPKPITIADMLDISSKNLEVQKKKALLPSEIELGQSTARKATTEANKAQFGFTNDQGIVAQNEAARLLTDSRIKNAQNSPEGREGALRALDEVANTLKTKGLHDDVIKGMLGQYYTQAIHDPTQISPKLTQGLMAASGANVQLDKLYPATTQVDVGGNLVTTAQGNPLLAAEQPGVPTGPYLQKSLAPQVATSPTGGPMQFGGGGVPQAGNLENRPVSVQTAPAQGGGANVTNMPANVPTKASGVTPKEMSQPKAPSGPIPYMQGETYEAYKNRVAKVQQSVGQANEDINSANPNSVTNAKYTNEQILKALDDKNVRVGPLMQAIAEKTQGLNLTADEQYVKKLLEQRIQQQNSRSDADQTSKTIANGNFGNSKEAIRNVLYKDMGNLTAKELQARGTLNKAGNINKPNLLGVNEFQNQFAKNSEPEVTHLMGIIGNKPLNQLTKTEIAHLQKEFSGMSKENFNALMQKRQKLIDSVGK
jgi:hypothetical protein